MPRLNQAVMQTPPKPPREDFGDAAPPTPSHPDPLLSVSTLSPRCRGSWDVGSCEWGSVTALSQGHKVL